MVENRQKKMETREKPITSWEDTQGKNLCGDRELENLLDSCIGEDDSCMEESSTSNEIVSIRCRRHKKRFNVERSWLKTSSWLCPRCYEKLSTAERLCYSPSGGGIEVRPAEKGKPVVYAKVDSKIQEDEKQRQKKICLKAQSQPKRHEEKALLASPKPKDASVVQVEPTKTISGNAKKVQAVTSLFSPDIIALMPTWRMKCLKCKKEAPVHKVYLESVSSVICPECHSQMSQDKIQKFHARHPASDANVWQVEYVKRSEVSAGSMSSNFGMIGESDISTGGCYSNSRIMQMSIKELTDAVHRGKVSRVRARIEMSRRKNLEYFRSLPDVTPNKPCLH